jgi:hypothetical protein
MKTDNSKSTVLVISTGFLIIYFIFSAQWAITVSLLVGVTGILSPYLSRKIEWLWMKLSKLLGYIVPNILLSIIFYLFLFPISVLFRIFNKDPLMISDKYKTYFIDVNKVIDKENFKKTW